MKIMFPLCLLRSCTYLAEFPEGGGKGEATGNLTVRTWGLGSSIPEKYIRYSDHGCDGNLYTRYVHSSIDTLNETESKNVVKLKLT